MAIILTDLEDFDEPARVLIYGDTGAGKTILAATCPDVLIAACESGVKSARQFGLKAKVYKSPTWPQFAQFITACRKGEVDLSRHKWLVIDSSTKLQELMIRHILNVEYKNSNHVRDLDTLQIQDYSKWYNMWKRYVNAINDLPINVMHLAHAMRSEDEEGEPLILPMFTGKNGTDDPKTMSYWMCGSVDLLGYLSVKGQGGESENSTATKFSNTLIIRRYGPFIAKDRYNLGPASIDNPNMATIAKRIETVSARRAG